ncbi:DinB family protein [Rossellomorea sp. YZS02]|uniref:DinB family protein n=1 Tax=Rossellomorea sp. YZS02 TaxID=3097358 RepID=UPI002A0CD695|nr:DinB family protein [Rossellomorea sp. YZS02]MDX8342410.1 DinB family protein [Rossellomorea sp. YZS02]
MNKGESVIQKNWLINKFAEIRNRILKALSQLTDEQVNWMPGDTGHSVSTLIRHIDGNIKERIHKGICNGTFVRNREDEFKPMYRSKEDLIQTVRSQFQFVIDTITQMSEASFLKSQLVRGRERTNLEILHQCAAHFSEHMGQILYIAKLSLKDDYISTSI